MKKEKKKSNRKAWFRGLKGFLKIFIRKPKFIYLGEKTEEQSIILSNHVGAMAPLKWELYFENNFRFWGTYEMNSGLKEVYKYLSTIYFHQKKHMPKFIAKVVAVIAAPLLRMFYRGLNLIPTYTDYRLRQTMRVSDETLNKNETIIIFPEDSHDGYHDELTKCFPGFALLASIQLKKDRDLPIYLAYYRKKDKAFVIDKPVMYSTLEKTCADKYHMADYICERLNTLRNIDISELKK